MPQKIIQVFVLFFLSFVTTINLHAQSDTLVEFLNSDKQICAPEKMVYYAIQFKENTHYKRITYYKYDNHIAEISYYLDSLRKNQDGLYRAFYKDNKISEKGTYLQNKKVGIWRSWHQNGKIKDSSFYENGLRTGNYLSWHDDGKLSDSSFYKNGVPTGLSLSWNKDGTLSDSINYDDKGNGKGFGFWENGIKQYTGEYALGKKTGLWTYFYKSGIICQEVIYKQDSAISLKCFDEKGNVENKECVEEKEASFKGGEKEWIEYLKKKLSNVNLPSEYYRGEMYGTCQILFIVNTDGKLTDFKIENSIGDALDKIAIEILKESPKWIPAIQHNRKVRAYRMQPITFAKPVAE